MVNGLSTSIQYLKGIGPKRAEQLRQYGLVTVEDLLYFFPRAYQDRTHIIPIAKVPLGEVVTVQGCVTANKGRQSYWRRGFAVVEVSVADDSGRLFAVWFNQPYLRNTFKVGDTVLLHGKAELYKDRVQIASPDYEILDTDERGSAAAGIVPFYSLPSRFSQRMFRRITALCLDKYLGQVKEALPFDIRERHKLLNIAKSLRQIHYPASQEDGRQAYLRLSFEEFFLYQIPIILRKRRKKEKKGVAFRVGKDELDDFRKILPFFLTGAQERAIVDIEADMSSSRPMQRLLQGDVGSGKTVVALFASVVAANNGYQTAFMVPTEILAGQHYEKLKAQLSIRPQTTDHGPQDNIRIGLLTSSLSAKDKKKALDEIKKGEVDIVIGTHALIQQGVDFHKLGLIVIDEQHKFGVSQRALLPQKGLNPDILIMTATPIPRTLALTLYGDLDVSVIDEMPAGRQKIKTESFGVDKRFEVFEKVKSELKAGRQAFVVYPIIEDNPKLELASAKSMFKEFSVRIFKGFRVGLIHGRLERDEQDKVMSDFREGALDILVATTVLEVGIDVPNATVMVIEHADRFGLSQLHQMRGRIGRGPHASFCYLIADASTEDAKARLDVMVAHLDGFKIAEEDLKIRGPGEYFGERQHGLTELKIANPLTQMHLLKSAREEVVRLLDKDPSFKDRNNQETKRQLYRRYPEFEKFVEVG